MRLIIIIVFFLFPLIGFASFPVLEKKLSKSASFLVLEKKLSKSAYFPVLEKKLSKSKIRFGILSFVVVLMGLIYFFTLPVGPIFVTEALGILMFLSLFVFIYFNLKRKSSSDWKDDWRD